MRLWLLNQLFWPICAYNEYPLSPCVSREVGEEIQSWRISPMEIVKMKQYWSILRHHFHELRSCVPELLLVDQ